MKSKSQKTKTFAIWTLGCPKNVADSEKIAGALKKAGLTRTEDSYEADVLIVNTCGFIDAAKEESVSAIVQAIGLKRQGRVKKIIATGCLTQRYKKELKRQLRETDAFYGVEAWEEIASRFAKKGGLKFVGERDVLTPPHYAYLKISDGCDRKCSFCAIPLIKGKHKSVPMEELIKEARALAARGAKELILISQDSTAYGVDLYGKRRIIELLEELEKIEGFKWIRLMYLYPKNFPLGFLDLAKNSEKIVPYVDIPLQHISDGVLKSMKRGITGAKTRALIEKIREKAPEATIRSAFIVGYPTETEKDFLELLDFIKEYKLDRAGAFTYSMEEGTSASELGDPVPPQEKKRRYDEFMKTQRDISLEKNKSLIGKKFEILIDEIDASGRGVGRTEKDAPDIDNAAIFEEAAEFRAGDFVFGKVVRAEPYDIYVEKTEAK